MVVYYRGYNTRVKLQLHQLYISIKILFERIATIFNSHYWAVAVCSFSFFRRTRTLCDQHNNKSFCYVPLRLILNVLNSLSLTFRVKSKMESYSSLHEDLTLKSELFIIFHVAMNLEAIFFKDTQLK